MNKRNQNDLEKFLDACTPEENQPIEEVKKDLESYGYNVDSIIAETLQVVDEIKQAAKPSWLELAANKQAKFEDTLKKASSWASRPLQEIEQAFQKAIATKQAQAAFRNVETISIEDKAAFLDELEALNELEQNDSNA